MFTISATIRHPLDPNALTELDLRLLRVLPDSDDLSDALVSANERGRCFDRPIPLADVEIGVADARADYLDETLAGLELGWLGDGEVALHDDGLLGSKDDSCDLGLGDMVRHGGWVIEG